MTIGRHLDLLRFVLRWDGSFWRRSPGKITGSLVRAHRPSSMTIAAAGTAAQRGAREASSHVDSIPKPPLAQHRHNHGQPSRSIFHR